jgi:hypothetical protein
MKRILFSVLPAILFWLGSCCIVNAQNPGPPVATSDQITLQNQQTITASSTTGVFDPVTVDPSAATTVQLQFPLSAAGMTVVVQVLDGGLLGINGNSAVIDQSGMLTFPFQVTGLPGLYRVLVVANDQTLAQVQFWVPNPPGP